ncbi:hypothetical protein E2C01_050177 [Portunus trituberculatus]|uniref:Uncharacterized protein n=1 Tax=Portunus trituberculatus TaxID=210409 RepID=A0A5B7GI74_PORTR|nr:hypothetical protein [Portunus trituberculatus]
MLRSSVSPITRLSIISSQNIIGRREAHHFPYTPATLPHLPSESLSAATPYIPSTPEGSLNLLHV